jgi:hypothetical protein
VACTPAEAVPVADCTPVEAVAEDMTVVDYRYDAVLEDMTVVECTHLYILEAVAEDTDLVAESDSVLLLT